MKMYEFRPEAGHNISQFGSVGAAITHLVDTSDMNVVCMYLTQNGLVGYHQATDNQLFLVVQGEGWVRGENQNPVAITSGQAAFWQAGEWHESGTEHGMMAIVIEGKTLNPTRDMQPLNVL